MTGWLIVNEYLNTEKFRELQDLFKEAALAKNIQLSIYTNAQFCVDLVSLDVTSKAFDGGIPDFIIFYDKDVKLAEALENRGLLVFNSARAIEVCDSKVLTEAMVASYNKCCGEAEQTVKMPKTFMVPFTYENIGISKEARWDFLDQVEEMLSNNGDKQAYPLIIKESYSSFGMGVHIANSREEAIDIICEFGNKECLIQEYIKSSSGTDIRIQMVGQKLVTAMKRSNSSDFRANITNGGQMSTYDVTVAELEMARAVMKALNLDFAGIDIMHDEDGNPVFGEANSNAHFKNLYDLTGINTAEYMLDYIEAIVNQNM